ncbi:MAG TPA: hypothetical protein VEH27_12090 [Methylomirabilota bacterium]|nr:hypothetical protein [Methylomirabilota bacterium]
MSSSKSIMALLGAARAAWRTLRDFAGVSIALGRLPKPRRRAIRKAVALVNARRPVTADLEKLEKVKRNATVC